MEFTREPLANRTSLRIGGAAERFVEPETEVEVRDALARAADEDWPVRALGGGKNLLVDDGGVAGLVLSFRRLKAVEFREEVVVAAAGTALPYLLRRAVSEGLTGLEALAGVPGTLGGAVRMNAGGAGGDIGSRVAWVRGFDRYGEEFRFSGVSCGFRYRGSRLGGLYVTEAALRLKRSGADLAERVRRIFGRKRDTQPLDAATAGCVFKNPSLPGGESAGWLLDRAGLRGLSRGGAAYSDLHANFVVNRGGASFEDVRWLIREGRRRVFERFGVELELEVEVWMRQGEEALLVA
jgi:UDP-N-acetylmuramate dehydrogenase